MAVTHPTSVRNGIADHVVTQINTGGAGSLEFQTAASAVIATLTFATDAFLNASGGVAAAAAIGDDTDCEPGTVSKFVVKSGGGSTIFQGTVTDTATNTGDIILSSVAIGQGDTISISSLTYEAPQ